jgi:hypothetical protein
MKKVIEPKHFMPTLDDYALLQRKEVFEQLCNSYVLLRHYTDDTDGAGVPNRGFYEVVNKWWHIGMYPGTHKVFTIMIDENGAIFFQGTPKPVKITPVEGVTLPELRSLYEIILDFYSEKWKEYKNETV